MANAWSAFYWRDYIADTGHLSLAEHGAYLLLMAHYYMTGKPLPAELSVLHRVCRCTNDAERTAADQVLQQFFILDGGVYSHHRIDQELAKAAQKTKVRRAAANASHRKRDVNARENTPANQMHLQTQPQPQPQPRMKNPSASPAREVADPRHGSTRELIQQLHRETFDSACPWDGSEGTALKRLLDSNRSWTQAQIDGMVRNRFLSEGVNGDRPREWIPHLSKYAGGPLDRFGKNGGNGNGRDAGHGTDLRRTRQSTTDEDAAQRERILADFRRAKAARASTAVASEPEGV